MSCATTPMLKTLFTPKGCLSSIPPFSAKLPYISLSAPSKLHCSCSLSASNYSLKRRAHPSTTVTHVAQTSDWAVASEDGEADVGGGGEESYQEPPEEAKLFVGNLSYDVDSEKLANLFEPAGVVEIAEVIYNRDTNQSRGFGFVTFSTVEEAEKAIEMFNQYDLNGRLLTVNKATERGARPERQLRTSEGSFKAYVGNLPWDVESGDLERMFSKFGTVVSARVVSDRDTNRSRGFGFVTMASEAELNNAISNLDGESLGGRALKVNVAEERPRRSF